MINEKKQEKKMDEKFYGGIEELRKIINSKEIELHTAKCGLIKFNGHTNQGDFLKAEYNNYGVEISAQCTMFELQMLFNSLVEEIGIENCLGFMAARHLKSVNSIKQTFNSREELDVAKKMMDMSPEELEKIRNRIK